MKETLRIVAETLRDYGGKSLYLAAYAAAVIYLYITEKEKQRRLLFLYLPFCVFVVFVFPLTAYFIMHVVMDTEIYYRQLWLLPSGITVSYALCRAVMKTKAPIRKAGILLAGLAVIIIGGHNAFTAQKMWKSENPQHLPQYVINVCNVIKDDGLDYRVTAAFPPTMLTYIRQYTAEILTPYGREMMIDRWWQGRHELYDALEEPVLDAGEVAELARAYHVECIVVYSFKEILGNMEEYGFYKVASVDGYDIYMERWLAEFHGVSADQSGENARNVCER